MTIVNKLHCHKWDIRISVFSTGTIFVDKIGLIRPNTKPGTCHFQRSSLLLKSSWWVL